MVLLKDFFRKCIFKTKSADNKKAWNITHMSNVNSLHAGQIFILLLSSDFFKIYLFKKFFQERYQSVKRLVPNLGPNFLQRLSAEDKSCC